MSNIRLLDTNTINKIAAGEVVERPASCVKELIENALDAGAAHIEIEVTGGGKSLIRVTDDGCGMTRADATLAIRRHATSKLASVTDLLSISTLGFRGEAIPTIAAVSKFTLLTRRAENELGTRITITGGRLDDTHETGCQIGTTVLVEDLFFNTPARLKFLKSTATESNKINDYVIKLALSRPDVAFKFINSNKIALNTPGSGADIDALASIYGTENTNSLLPVALELEDFKLSGFVGKPTYLRSYRGWQTFVVNGRVVGNRTISKAIEESYKALIPNTGYPFALLKIDVPQSSIDVNVHPQKAEIKFEDEGKIFRAIHRAIREALTDGHEDLTEIAVAPAEPRYEPINLDEYFGPRNADVKNFSVEKARAAVKQAAGTAGDFSGTDSVGGAGGDFGGAGGDFVIEETSPPPVVKPPKPVEKPPNPVKKSPEPVKPQVVGLEPLGQIDLCYIVARGGRDLYVIDQHAAHERILFDRLSGYAEGIPAQILLIHRVMKFDAREAAFLERNLELFSKLGLTMELSGENEFRLVEVPLDAADSDPEALIREIIASLPDLDDASFDATDLAAKIRKSFLAVTACRAAIKAGQELNARQMEILLDDLSRTAHPHTCPHGRPTILKFTSGDLAKMFKRT